MELDLEGDLLWARRHDDVAEVVDEFEAGWAEGVEQRLADGGIRLARERVELVQDGRPHIRNELRGIREFLADQRQTCAERGVQRFLEVGEKSIDALHDSVERLIDVDSADDRRDVRRAD